MKSLEQLARSGYEAYCLSVGLQSWPWPDLPESTRKGWVAAAQKIVAEMASVH